ncbi:MAG: GGDEF domain-containing protein [Eubacterium sp.]|nr:GGDEF domain-containing protein [Eubacterium sp.]
MAAIKAFLLRDVKNENESSKPAIEIRLTVLGIMGYFLLMVAGELWSRDYWMLLFTVPCLFLYGAVFALTYFERVLLAAYGLNVFMVIWIVISVYSFGWELGVQQYLFLLILTDFFLPYWRLSAKLFYAGAMCLFRVLLFFYCQAYAPRMAVPEGITSYYHVVNTVSIYSTICMYGCLISSNFLVIEKKLIETNKKLLRQAGTDPLTQLMNRMRMLEYASEQMARQDDRKALSVAVGDIDHFKHFNDTYGHACGDAVLKTLSSLFEEVMQPYGAVARWGGEEFLFLFKECNGKEAYQVLAKLREEMKQTTIAYGGMSLRVTMTFGLAEIDPAYPLEESIRRADELLYEGKAKGRDQVVYEKAVHS